VVERRFLETIDFDLMILRTRCFAAISSTSALMSAGVSREQHRRAARGGIALEDLEPDVEVLERAVADRLAASRVPRSRRARSVTIGDWRRICPASAQGSSAASHRRGWRARAP
jgi:hypothetical protein